MRLVAEAPDDDQAVLDVPHRHEKDVPAAAPGCRPDVHVGQKTVTP